MRAAWAKPSLVAFYASTTAAPVIEGVASAEKC